jgi:hypothetical protein
MLAPRLVKSNTDSEKHEPKRVNPSTDSDDPMRTNVLRESEAPMCE